MKLRTKLLPIFGLVATTGVALPIVTSCNKNNNVEVFTVTFDANGGSAVASQKVIKDELIHEPASTKNGYILLGWASNDKLWDFNTDKATGDITLKAVWVGIPETNLLTVDIVESHPQETKVDTEAAGAKIYFNDGTPTETIKKDILIDLVAKAKALEATEFISPGSIIGFEWVGKIYGARAEVKINKVEYVPNSTKAYLSGEIILSLNSDMIESESNDEQKESIGEYVLITHHILNAVPYELRDFDEKEHEWSCRTTLDLLKAEKNWTLDRSYYGIAFYNNGQIEVGKDVKNWSPANVGTMTKDNITPITWDSTYMNTVEHGTK